MESNRVQLRPLLQKDAQSLYSNVGADPEIFQWMTFAGPASLADYEKLTARLIKESETDFRKSFAVVLKESNQVIGHTSFMDYQARNRSIEIGTTFYGKKYWRSFVNTECKLLLLTNAFEIQNLNRVTLKTDGKNERSKSAIVRIGATYEGALRENMQRPDGSWRDTAYFSILESEWPAVKDRLVKLIK
jgi:RimJ/RimL family protein N-acetyltransferase